MRRTAVLLVFCGWSSASPEPVLMVVVNQANKVETLSKSQLRRLLLGEERRWPSREPVIVVQRDPDSPAFLKMLRVVLRMTVPEYKRWLLAAEFRGEDAPRVKTLNSNEGAAKFVFNVPGAIAVVDESLPQALGGELRIVRVDGKLPGDDGYGLK